MENPGYSFIKHMNGCWLVRKNNYVASMYVAWYTYRVNEEDTRSEDWKESFRPFSTTAASVCIKWFEDCTGLDWNDEEPLNQQPENDKTGMNTADRYWEMMPKITTPSHTHSFTTECAPANSISSFTTVGHAGPVSAPKSKRKKGKTTMRDYDFDSFDDTVPVSMEAKKQSYLLDRLYDTHAVKQCDLKKQFGLLDDDAPRTPEELIDRITSGKYVLPEKDKRYRYYGALELFQWRDPSKKRDDEGFTAANTLLEKELTNAKDAIMIKSGDDGLAALKALEEWQPTGAAS